MGFNVFWNSKQIQQHLAIRQIKFHVHTIVPDQERFATIKASEVAFPF